MFNFTYDLISSSVKNILFHRLYTQLVYRELILSFANYFNLKGCIMDKLLLAAQNKQQNKTKKFIFYKIIPTFAHIITICEHNMANSKNSI